jgi:hypothetical protein
MNWIVNILGIALYFLIRYGNRTDKSIKFSGTFWLNDNWIETVSTIVINALLMIIFSYNGFSIDYEKLVPALPDWVSITGDLVTYAVIGLLLSHLAYEFVNKIIKGK